jgi:hypothetical protein
MKLKWIALFAALAIPALGWAASSGAKAKLPCPLPCAEDCPFKR